MNISIESLFLNQNGIEYTWSNNGGEESEIEKMSKEDFAKLLCEYSNGWFTLDEEYDEVSVSDVLPMSEDTFTVAVVNLKNFIETELNDEPDYCKDCLVKHIQSQNKN